MRTDISVRNLTTGLLALTIVSGLAAAVSSIAGANAPAAAFSIISSAFALAAGLAHQRLLARPPDAPRLSGAGITDELKRARAEAEETSKKLRKTVEDLEAFALIAVRREVKMKELREKLAHERPSGDTPAAPPPR